MDDLDYFPGGTWRSDDDVAYQGYANPGAAWQGDRYRRGGQPDSVWQRLADAPWSPLGTPAAVQPRVPGEQLRVSGEQLRVSGEQPGYSGAGWPHVPLGRESARSAAPSWDTPDGERPYPNGRPPAGYARWYGSDPGTAGDRWPDDGLRDTGPRDWLRDTGPRDWLRDSGPGRPPEPVDGGHARRQFTRTSLIAGHAPATRPAHGRGGTARPAGSPQAPAGRTLPAWLPFGSRLVLLPREQAAAADGELRDHRDVSGGWLRPAVFGAMDGLVTNSSLIAGIGGGGGAHGAIILTGVAGLIAGAFSMATGEYISVKSQNELTQAEVELERQQHARDRAGKLDRLTQVFMDKGVSPNLAEAVSRQISADPDRAVATHVREELGLDPDDLPSPRAAAIASFVSFTVGALVPLGPFLLGYPSLQLALVLAGLFAFGGGAVVARLAGRPALLGGLRQFAAAFLATGMAFFIGHLVGAHIG